MKKILSLFLLSITASSLFAATSVYCPSAIQIHCKAGECSSLSNFTVSEGGYPSPSLQATDFCGAQYNANEGSITCTYVDTNLKHRDPSTGKTVNDSCQTNTHMTIASFKKQVNLPLKNKAKSGNNWIVINEGQWGNQGWCYNPASVNVNHPEKPLSPSLCPISA